MSIKVILEKPKTSINTITSKGNLNNAVGTNISTNKIYEFTSVYEFPTLGEIRSVYIDKTNNAPYRWDDNLLKYYCIGRDYNEIDIIDGNA